MPTTQKGARQVRLSASKGAMQDRAIQARGSRSHPFRAGLVRRPELVSRLIEAHDAAFALLVAPPGYGKSTLLCEWAESDPRPFVWVTLDEHNSRSAEHAATAVRDALADSGSIAPARVSSLDRRDSATLKTALPDLTRAVGARDQGIVLVFDGAEALSPTALRKLTDATVSALPDGSTVAITSRVEPNVPTGRLRAHRQLVEIRMHDLAMAPAEAAVLLREAGLELDFEQVQALVRRTEGWPAALYLAALSLLEHREDGGFSGEDHMLAEYLRDDALSAVPRELSDFVLRTSVLEELSGPACDQLLQESGSACVLERLAHLSQLLVPLDAAHGRYRWHRLFGAWLRAELRRQEPDVNVALHSRASGLLADQGDIDGAIGHAVAAGDGARTGELLWPNLLAYLAQGRAEMVEAWLATLGPERISDSGPLALCAAHTALATGDIIEAQHTAQVAADALERDRTTESDATLTTGLIALETIVARKGALKMRSAAMRAHDGESDGSPWRPVLCLAKGVSQHLTGDRETARTALQEGADLGLGKAPGIAALCMAVEGMIAIETRDWSLAIELTDRAMAVIAERGLTAQPLAALVFAAASAARAHEGRADEAKRDLRSGLDLLAGLGDYIPWYGAEARILLAHASLWLADIVGARTLLAEASRLARKTPDAVIFKQWFDEAWGYMDSLAEASMSGPSALTIAELRVLRFLPSHRSFREIAMQLGVSANTVKTQAHAVYRKLGAASRSEAVARASEAGLLGQ